MIKMQYKCTWLPKVTVMPCSIPWENPYDSAEDVERAVMERCTGPPSSSINAFVHCLLNHLINVLKTSDSSGLTQSWHYVPVKDSTVETSHWEGQGYNWCAPVPCVVLTSPVVFMGCEMYTLSALGPHHCRPQPGQGYPTKDNGRPKGI